MIKRVNFTGRRRIPRNRAAIEVLDGHPRTFNAQIDLHELPLPPDAAVFLEATSAGSTTIQRFDFGVVSAMRTPCPCLLTDIEGENVFFSLKVVDRSQRIGRILGLAENIRPERAGTQTATGRRGILPIEQSELGQQLWRLEFKQQDVFLLVNKDVPGLIDRARSDPLFFAVVYPEVVRAVLAKTFQENADVDEEDDRWPVLWQRFGQGLHPNREKPPSGEAAEEEIEDWIDEVVSAFCEAHALRDKYTSTVVGGGEA